MSDSRFEHKFSKRIKRAKGSPIRELLAVAECSEFKEVDGIYMAGGLPNELTFPRAIEDIFHSFPWSSDDGFNLIRGQQYTLTGGYRPFVRAFHGFIRDFFCKEYGFGWDVSEQEFEKGCIVFGGGSQEGLAATEDVFFDPGDWFICKRPTYLGFHGVMKKGGHAALEVPTCGDDLDMGFLEDKYDSMKQRMGRDAKLVYVIPDFGNPDGTQMSIETRKWLLNFCKERDLLILEDWPYAALRFSGTEVIPPLFVLDMMSEEPSSLVMSLFTFSKYLGAGWRLAVLMGDESLIAKYNLNKETETLCSSAITQAVVGKYLQENDLYSNIKDNADFYEERVLRFHEIMAEKLPEVRCSKPKGAFFMFPQMPEGFDGQKALPLAEKHGLAYVPGDSFFYYNPESRFIRLNPGYFKGEYLDEMEIAAERLAKIVYEFLGHEAPYIHRIRQRNPDFKGLYSS